MARVSTYLDFARSTEAAFLLYKSVFQTDFIGSTGRWRDMPPGRATAPLPDADLDLVMHVELPIPGGHVLMGTDAPSSAGFSVTQGNNVHILLEPDTRAETDRLFAALAEGGQMEMPLQETFWGGYYGSFADRFGVRWMFNCAENR